MQMRVDNELQTRIITGSLLIGAVLLAIFSDSKFVIWLFLGAGFMFALHEALNLYGIKNNSIYFIALVVWLIAGFYRSPIELFFLILLIFGSIIPFKRDFDKRLLLPLIYPLVSFLFIFELYLYYGKEALFWLFVVVASVDIGSYFGGKAIGKTLLCEVSPSKTIEGAAIGIACGTLFGSFVSLMLVDFLFGLFASIVVAIFSVFGDLYESLLKREANLKDSGSLFPGHGGVLDRIDGYLFASIALFLILRAFY